LGGRPFNVPERGRFPQPQFIPQVETGLFDFLVLPVTAMIWAWSSTKNL